MAESKPTMLRVGELTNRDEFGRGIVRIDTKAMAAIGIKEGEIIELDGKRKTGVIAVRAYPADIGLNLIRMDGITRRNVGVGVGENIRVNKTQAKPADKVVLAPAQKGIVIQMNPNMLKKNLFMRPVMKKDIIMPFPVVRRRENSPFEEMFPELRDFFGGASFMPIPGDTRFVVVSTSPDGIVQVTEETELELKPEAVDVEEKERPTLTYEDIGGLDEPIQKIREMVELPLRHPELFTRLGIDPPKGVLLYGPPGTGKTLLAKAVANESGAAFFSIAGPEIMDKFYGASEENLRKLFEEAEKSAPSILFIDEIDSIAPKREEVTGEVERRVVSQLLTLMDGLKSRGKIIVIAATNRENSIDPALRRPGRFDREVEIGVPDAKGRKEILQIHTRNMPLTKDVDLNWLSSITYGFVGADVEALAKEAAMSALRRKLPGISWKKDEQLPPEVIENLKVEKLDFENALKMVEPSAMREVMIEIPNVKWEDVGGLDEVKELLKEVVEWPLKQPEAFKRIGIRPPLGVLLFGPPGTGKTMLAKAVAHEAGANFISIKGPEVMNKWVGESEKRIRDIFRRAKQVAPAIIFFDEIDSVAPKRGMNGSSSHVMENVVSSILSEMSGLEELHNVVVLATTNRPDIIDPALLRPGRFDRQILVPAPDEKTRLEILKIHTKSMPLKGVDIKVIAKETDGYSGADLEALAREAGLNALRKDIKAKEVTAKNFNDALEKVKPSINANVIEFYRRIEDQLKTTVKEKKAKEDDELVYVG